MATSSSRFGDSWSPCSSGTMPCNGKQNTAFPLQDWATPCWV
jgi:hypothetical protein